MTPDCYAAGGLGPTSSLKRPLEQNYLRSHLKFFPVLWWSGATARFSNPTDPRRNQYAPICMGRSGMRLIESIAVGQSVTLFHAALDIALGITLGEIIALVVEFFAFAQTDFHLDASVFEVQVQWNQRKPLFHCGLL